MFLPFTSFHGLPIGALARPVEPPPPLELIAPVLARTSSDGTNPMTWTTYFEAIVVGEDYARLRWRVDGGAWTTEDDVLLDEELASALYYDNMEGGEGVLEWPLFAAATFAADELVEVQGGLRRGSETAWGNIISDTMAGAASAVFRRAEVINVSYSPGTYNLASPVTIDDGDKVLVLVHGNYNGATITFAANSGAITFTKIGSGGAAGAEAFYADTSGATSLDLALTTAGFPRGFGVHVLSIKGAAAGLPADDFFEVRSIAGQDNHDVDGGLEAPANGVMVILVGERGSNPITGWVGATEVSEVLETDWRSAVAVQTTPANATVAGQSGGGISYDNMHTVVTTWSP